MNNNDLRQYINIVNENTLPDYEREQLAEAGGMLDKPLAALGHRAAKGRIALKQYYKDLLGDWREYAAEIGLDKSRIFSQNNFPASNFADFLKTEYDFDDDMVSEVKGLRKKGKADVRQVMKSAAEVYAKRARGIGKTQAQPASGPTGASSPSQPASGPTKASPKASAAKQDIDQTQVYFKQAKGDLKRAVNQAKSVLGKPKDIYALNDLEKAGLAYLAARGHL